MYGKIFASLYEGSLVGAGPTVFAVIGYCIAKADPDTHCVILNPSLLCAVIGTTKEDVERAIEHLEKKDPDSKNPDHEGRRIVKDSGFTYFFVSHEHYRNINSAAERCAYERERKRRQRESRISQDVPIVPDTRGQSGTPVYVSVSDSGINKASNVLNDPRTTKAQSEEIYSLYPRKIGRGAAFKKIEPAIKKFGFEELRAKVIEYAESVRDKEQQFIPHPATWFGQERYRDEIEKDQAKPSGSSPSFLDAL